MPGPKCVTIQRTAIAASALWVLSVLAFLAGTVVIAMAGVHPLGFALGAAGILLAGAACVVSVKALLDKQQLEMLDEVALLHHERDAAWRKAIEDGECPNPSYAPPLKRIGQSAEQGAHV